MTDELELLEKIRGNVIHGKCFKDEGESEHGISSEPANRELVVEALERGVHVKHILVYGLAAGMEEIGHKFEQGEYFIPDMLAAAEVVGETMELIEPYLNSKDNSLFKGKFVLATVEKDQHDIGKNMVGTMLKGAGFQVIDLGVDVPAEKIVKVVREEKPDFLGLSALLNTTMMYMKSTIKRLQEEKLRSEVWVFVGGAPTSPEFAKSIEADIYCEDAFEAITIADRLIGGRREAS